MSPSRSREPKPDWRADLAGTPEAMDQRETSGIGEATLDALLGAVIELRVPADAGQLFLVRLLAEGIAARAGFDLDGKFHGKDDPAAQADQAMKNLKILVEETITRFPTMSIAGEPTWVLSQFSSQLKTLPVRL